MQIGFMLRAENIWILSNRTFTKEQHHDITYGKVGLQVGGAMTVNAAVMTLEHL